MAKYKVCEKCGAALDHGEVCDCERENREQKDVLYEANQASSASAALNGLAVLLREYAALVGVNPVEVLALLATVLTVPAMKEE